MSRPDLVYISMPMPLPAFGLLLKGLCQEYPDAAIITDGPDYRPGFATLRLGRWQPPGYDEDDEDDEDE